MHLKDNFFEWIKTLLLIIIMVCAMKIAYRTKVLMEEKTLRVTEVHHIYDIKSYGTVNLPGDLKTDVKRKE